LQSWHRLIAELGGTKSTQRSPQLSPEHWKEEFRDSFEALKTKLTNARVLAYADFSRPFILEVDSSYGGLGAVLSQEQKGKVRPIAYASRGQRPTERNMANYSSMKLEFLALKWAMTEKFQEYLLGHRCIVTRTIIHSVIGRLLSSALQNSVGQLSWPLSTSRSSTVLAEVTEMQMLCPVNTHLVH